MNSDKIKVIKHKSTSKEKQLKIECDFGEIDIFVNKPSMNVHSVKIIFKANKDIEKQIEYADRTYGNSKHLTISYLDI